MNNYQILLYNDLMKLTDDEAFYYADRQLDDKWYRIFNYRLASYTEFQKPGAMECRGHMFEITEEGPYAIVVRLAALPMEKFFNLNENPFTMDLDLTEIESVMLKADGSLISTFIHENQLRLKTKGSLESDQAIAAMRWLELSRNEIFKQILTLVTERYNGTVNMEWCAPDNRIVIGYENAHLKILNIRDCETGKYADGDWVELFGNILNEHWIEYEYPENKVEFIESVPAMQKIEGYVIRLTSGQHVKIKTTWYLALHHTKDSINTPRRLYETVLAEGTDDMRSLFHDDPLAIKLIEDMEKFVEEKYNHLVDVVERYYKTNKDMERKEYAILGQKELKGKEFGLAMMKYTGKNVDYKAFMTKNWKYYGLKDEKVEVE